ncbi:MAG: hypothetical protein ABIK08_02245 [Pseudomonadota bacterium]
MDIDSFSFDHVGRQIEPATHPLARLVMRLPLSLVVAGLGLLPPHFAAATRPDAQSGTSNYGFQV